MWDGNKKGIFLWSFLFFTSSIGVNLCTNLFLFLFLVYFAFLERVENKF